MKRLYIISLTLLLLLSQLGAIDHAFHEHSPDEACEYCIAAKALDHAVGNSFLISAFAVDSATPIYNTSNTVSSVAIHYYRGRAPPHYI